MEFEKCAIMSDSVTFDCKYTFDSDFPQDPTSNASSYISCDIHVVSSKTKTAV